MAEAGQVAHQVASRLLAEGARAVVLVGSLARGDAGPTSDIDLVALGRGPQDHLELHDGWQVSISWRTPGEIRARWHSPADAGGAVPAWRQALVLHDSYGEATGLRAEAWVWDWTLIADAADRWVAHQVTGCAEEVHRLVGQRDGGSQRAAAVVRSVLALRLAVIMAVHRRILYDSENELWDVVAVHEGPQWTAAQDLALGVAPGGPAEPDGMAAAALQLYTLTAQRTARLLTEVQAAVVRRALAVANGREQGRRRLR